jgi:hypothetical protein
MPAPHLINALLKALAAAEPRSIIDPLTRELVRRGLEDAAHDKRHRGGCV